MTLDEVYKVYLYNDGDNLGRKNYRDNIYFVLRRVVTLGKEISGFNRNFPLYVWGRSGAGANSGWQRLIEGNFGNQVGWSHINSTDVKDSYSREIPGIEVKDERYSIRAENYQYKIIDNIGNITYWPPLGKNIAHITFFGVKNPSDVNTTFKSDKIKVYISPNPIKDFININISFSDFEKDFSIFLYNSLGQIVWKKTNNNKNQRNYYFKIPAINLPSGVYYCSVTSGYYINTKPVVVY